MSLPARTRFDPVHQDDDPQSYSHCTPTNYDIISAGMHCISLMCNRALCDPYI